MGCVAVAIFNVFYHLNRPMYLSKIILEFELNDYLCDGGAGGTYTSVIPKFLRAHNLSYTKFNSYSSFKKKASKYKISIVSISHKNGGHSFCIVKRNGKLYTLNRYEWHTEFMKVDWENIKSNFDFAYSFK